MSTKANDEWFERRIQWIEEHGDGKVYVDERGFEYTRAYLPDKLQDKYEAPDIRD